METAGDLDGKTKAAYRHLLYVAMLDIRSRCQSRGRERLNPLEWRRQYRSSRVAGAIADWLHNLAQFSSHNFRFFDEQRFWKEHGGIRQRFPLDGLERYREIFDEFLAGRVLIC